MLAIKLDEQQRAEGLRELILHGDVYCLPNHIFIVPLNSLRFLDKANISYTFVDGEIKNARSRKTKANVLHSETSN